MSPHKSKTTFLLGAGASKCALPLVDEIPDRLESFRLHLIDYERGSQAEGNVETSPRDLTAEVNGLCQHLSWLAANARIYGTVDTFAKKLFLTDSVEDLKRLKAVLSAFFLYEQLYNSVKIDTRYIALFAALLDKDISARLDHLPENVRIVSWNYDIQLERAFGLFRPDLKTLDSIQDKLNVFPLDTEGAGRPGPDRFTVYKLNGTCAAHEWKGQMTHVLSNISEFENPLPSLTLPHLIRMATDMAAPEHPRRSVLKFAWEHSDNGMVSVVESAQEDIRDTETLVVIGYSFPFFNRGVDRALMKGMQSLKHVYFQSADVAESQKYITRFHSMRDVTGVHLEPISDAKQFFLPPEL